MNTPQFLRAEITAQLARLDRLIIRQQAYQMLVDYPEFVGKPNAMDAARLQNCTTTIAEVNDQIARLETELKQAEQR